LKKPSPSFEKTVEVMSRGMSEHSGPIPLASLIREVGSRFETGDGAMIVTRQTDMQTDMMKV
jgi:hypothetical protein